MSINICPGCQLQWGAEVHNPTTSIWDEPRPPDHQKAQPSERLEPRACHTCHGTTFRQCYGMTHSFAASFWRLLEIWLFLSGLRGTCGGPEDYVEIDELSSWAGSGEALAENCPFTHVQHQCIAIKCRDIQNLSFYPPSIRLCILPTWLLCSGEMEF